MTRKQELYAFIQTGPTFNDWCEYVMTHPYLRIKKARATDVVINFDGKGEWFDPDSWAVNYKAHLLQRVYELKRDTIGIVTEEDVLEAFDVDFATISYEHQCRERLTVELEKFARLLESNQQDGKLPKAIKVEYLVQMFRRIVDLPEHISDEEFIQNWAQSE